MDDLTEYRLRISAMLKNHDDARTAFNRETINMQKKIDRKCSDKCFLSFLTGAILTTIICSSVFYYVKKNSDNNILYTIEKAIKGIK